jgi:hypothetical protein
MPLNGTALVITVGNIAATVQILKSSQANISNIGKLVPGSAQGTWHLSTSHASIQVLVKQCGSEQIYQSHT